MFFLFVFLSNKGCEVNVNFQQLEIQRIVANVSSGTPGKKNKKKGRREEEKGDAEGKAAAENQVKTIKKEINVTNK